MLHRRTIVLVLLATAMGCTTPRPTTLNAQRLLFEEARPESQRDWARLGWWRLLDDDSQGAASAFIRAQEDPLAALGRASLARQRLDDVSILSESARASSADGIVGELGRIWALEARDMLSAAVRKTLTGIANLEQIESDGHVLGVSYLPHLGLRRLRTEGFDQTQNSQEVEILGRRLSLVQSLDGMDPEALNLSRFTIKDGAAKLRFQVDGHFLIFNGSKRVLASALHRPPPGHAALLSPQAKHIWVAWSGPLSPRLFIESSAGSPSNQAPVGMTKIPGTNWLKRYLETQQALAYGDIERAHQLLAHGPKGRLFQMARAEAALGEWGVPASLRRKRARHALTELSGSARLFYKRFRLARDAGAQIEAELLLKQAMDLAPSAFILHRAHLRLLIASGRQAEARRLMPNVMPMAPSRCQLLDERMDLNPRRGIRLDTLIKDLTDCRRSDEAARHVLNRGFPLWALRIVGPAPIEPRARKIQIEALIALDRLPDAQKKLSGFAGPTSALLLHDLKGGTETHLRTVLRASPQDDTALEIFVMDSSLFPAPKDRFNTEAVIAQFEESNLDSGPATRVLDHNLVWMTESGHMVRWIHEIIAIGSRDAARFYGEANLPTGARPMMLYTRKADGRKLYTQELAEKDSLSFPDLEVGDYLVAQYLQVADNGYLYKRGFMTPRVWFQGVDMPIFIQRFSVYAPGEDTLDVESHGGAPAGQRVARQGGQGLRFESRLIERKASEQRSTDPIFWLPSVRVGRNISLGADLDWFRDQILGKRIRSSRFDAWVTSAVAKAKDPVEAISRRVRESIATQSGLIADGVTRAIQTGHGHRGLVMSAALESLGVDHQLLLARPSIQPEGRRFKQVADFQYPLIRLADGRWLDPGPDRASIGFVPFVYLGGEALVLWPPQADSTVKIPQERQVEDGRIIKAKLHWAEDGTIDGEVVDTITGQEAIVVGNALASRTTDERRQLVQYLFAGVVPAARIAQLEESTAKDPDGPLVMRYTFKAKMNERLSLGLFPVRPGRNFAILQRRQTDLQIELPVNQTVEFEVSGDLPFKVQGKGGLWSSKGARYASNIEHDGRKMTVKTELHVDGGLISQSDYQDFARWAREVGVAEQLVLNRARQ